MPKTGIWFFFEKFIKKYSAVSLNLLVPIFSPPERTIP